MKSAEKLFTGFLHLSKPWSVSSVVLNGDETRVDIRISADRLTTYACPHCGCACRGYDRRERTWRHMDLFDMECLIHCAVPRVECGGCGRVSTVDVPWAEEGSGFTLLFESKSIQLMKEMPVNSTARYLGVTDKRLWRALDDYVEERMSHQDLSHVDRFYVDETSCRRGHSHIGMFVDQNHDIVFVTDGNDASAVTRFREHLEAHGGDAAKIGFVCCDMGRGFRAGIAAEFPQAVVTYDRYHVMQHMSKAVDGVRRSEWNRLRGEGRLKEATDLKGRRYTLLRNSENLSPEQRGIVNPMLNPTRT